MKASARREANGRKREQRQRRRRMLDAEARQITRRLARAVVVNPDGPVLGRSKPVIELSERSRATAHGGVALVGLVARSAGLAAEIDSRLELLATHRPYHESDHVLNLAFNALCGGTCLQDIELRRNDRAFLDGLGVASLPDPTTAGDFCRRFDADAVACLQEAVMAARMRVWAAQPGEFFAECARIDADASIVATTGDTKEGMGISYDGTWGYSALTVSLANTGEPLYQSLLGANRPSHEGAADLFDKAVTACRGAGFADVVLRGDTDYSLTAHFDAWTDSNVRFVFGYDARKNMVALAEGRPDDDYHSLVVLTDTALAKAARAEAVTTGAIRGRAKPARVKDKIVAERGFKTITTIGEDVCEFDYQPGRCDRPYRVVALRKDLRVTGENSLFATFRYFFYITNDRQLSADEVIAEARNRCNQENLHAQLKASRALHAPLDTLNANWAWMTMVGLAWTLKAWTALLLPVSPRWADSHREQKRRLLRMEFRTFTQAFIALPAQIVTTGRRIRWRLQTWNPWLPAFFRLYDTL